MQRNRIPLANAISLQELDRLREHLVAVEDGYTQEALATEERERELRRKLQVRHENHQTTFLVT